MVRHGDPTWNGIARATQVSRPSAGEEPANQMRKCRITRANGDKDALTNALNSTCNPFASDSPAELVNISSGRQRRMRQRRFFLTHSREGSDCDYNSRVNAQPMHHGF